MNDIISQIKKKYIQNEKIVDNNKLNRNLQAEINKIESIKTLVNKKSIDKIELIRLEFSLETLLKTVRNLKCKKHQE